MHRLQWDHRLCRVGRADNSAFAAQRWPKVLAPGLYLGRCGTLSNQPHFPAEDFEVLVGDSD